MPPLFALALHGGAGTIDKAKNVDRHVYELRRILANGRDLLQQGASSIDVVEQVVSLLEDCELFNAGRGAVLTDAATFELEASIMTGDKRSGAVTGCKTIKNPIHLARAVLEQGRHHLIGFDGAEKMADSLRDIQRVEQDYFFTQARHDQWSQQLGTVGAVARDVRGQLAVATSTGGRQRKQVGRIGDTPGIGHGFYADNATLAVSGTGNGEEFMRHCTCHAIHLRMRLGASMQSAVDAALLDLGPDVGGVVCVNAAGEVLTRHNTTGMYRGVCDSNGLFQVGIWDEMK